MATIELSAQEKDKSTILTAQEVCAQIRQTHNKPAIPFAFDYGDDDLTGSKLGGTPYLPHDMAWPCNHEGIGMSLLAQINCNELEALPDFPHTGLLQFFVDDHEGDAPYINYDDPYDTRYFRVLYHERIDPSVTVEDVEAKRPAPPHLPRNDRFIEKTHRIVFGTPQNQGITAADGRFDRIFVEHWNYRRPDKRLESALDLELHFPEDIHVSHFGDTYDRCFNEPGKDMLNAEPYHQIGGYPYFTQNDPRNFDDAAMPDILLLQIDSEYESGEDIIMWGDNGVGNFFINSEDLKQRDFSRVYFTWDCC